VRRSEQKGGGSKQFGGNAAAASASQFSFGGKNDAGAAPFSFAAPAKAAQFSFSGTAGGTPVPLKPNLGLLCSGKKKRKKQAAMAQQAEQGQGQKAKLSGRLGSFLHSLS
jgi:hypothetical protein